MVAYKRFLDSSIKNKLIFMGMSLCVITVLIMSSALAFLNAMEIKSNISDELSLLSKIIGKRSTAAIVYTQFDKVQENLHDLQSVAYIESGCVYDAENNLIAKYQSSEYGNAKTCPDQLELIPNGVSFYDDFVVSKQDIFFDGEERIGSICFYGNLSKLHEKFIEVFTNGILIISITLLIAYLFANHLQRIISSPILGLAKLTNEVAKGNYDFVVTPHSRDEIGTLTDGFHYMLNAIRERDTILNKLNSSLEKEVQARTKDLEFTINQLKKANEAKKLWVQNIGHELRTPIHAINSFTEIGQSYLKVEPVDVNKLGVAFNRIELSGARLVTLINDLLDFGKLESGKTSFNFGKYNIENIMQRAIEETAIIFGKKNINVIYKNDAKSPLVCDEKRIIQVMLNLLSNAAKFSPDGSNVTILTKDCIIHTNKGLIDAINITIADEGVGIPADELESIFDTFVQSSKTTDGSGGTGLGLSICKEIIFAHDGFIKAENNNGKGAKFIVTLPLG